MSRLVRRLEELVLAPLWEDNVASCNEEEFIGLSVSDKEPTAAFSPRCGNSRDRETKSRTESLGYTFPAS